MSNLVKGIIFVVATRIIIALGTAAAIVIDDVPACTSFTDIITGCSGILGILTSFALGTIPSNTFGFLVGVGFYINIFLAFIGFCVDIAVVWAIIRLVRGGG